jgi:tetratricopeptide (TPR) repeat protein
MNDIAALEAQIAELVAMGRQFLDAGRVAEAETLFVGLRAVTKADFEVNKQLGIVLATKGDFAGAREPLEDAIRLSDRDAVAFNVLSVCAFETRDYPAALEAAERALRLRRAYPEAHNSRGNALLKLDRAKEAIEAFKAALMLAPRDPELHANLGHAYELAGRTAEALVSVDRALAMAPGLVVAHLNRGNVLQKLGRLEDALAAYEAALRLDPNSVDGHWNRGLLQLLFGDYATGWADYEWRWRRRARETQPRGFPQPMWLGREDLAGRTILLYGEQGLGDCIQFARYAPRVAARGARVVLEAYPPLAGLFEGLPGVSRVVRRGEPLPDFDLHTALMSLPLALGELQPAPEPEPYLRPDPILVAAWAGRLGTATALRVGLACSGSPTHGKDAQRSIAFAAFAAGLPAGPEYHLLQKEVREADAPALAARPDVNVWTEALGDLSDTAALAANLDLVISVDTGVAHLCGAIGRPTWVLLPTHPDWRWRLERDTSDWYAQMRLYRQTSPGDWTGPLQAVARDLAAAAAAPLRRSA